MNSTPLLVSENLHSTREAIISILSHEWPLTTKQLWLELKKKHDFKGTYQAAHKIINKMAQEKILVKENHRLMLDKNWIEQLHTFSENLEKTYTKNPPETIKENTIYLSFDCIADLTKYIINDYYSNASMNPEKKPCVCYWNHVYPAIGIDKKEFTNLKKMFQHPQHYGIAKNNTPADKHFSLYLEKMGKKCANGKDYSPKNDTFIHGEYILEIFFSPQLSKQIQKTYSEVKNANKIELQKFFELVTNTNHKINAIIYKNHKLAEKLTEEAIKIYEKRNKNG